jgi:hypothetical protein
MQEREKMSKRENMDRLRDFRREHFEAHIHELHGEGLGGAVFEGEFVIEVTHNGEQICGQIAIAPHEMEAILVLLEAKRKELLRRDLL